MLKLHPTKKIEVVEAETDAPKAKKQLLTESER
jgi:hypothetical protein